MEVNDLRKNMEEMGKGGGGLNLVGYTSNVVVIPKREERMIYL